MYVRCVTDGEKCRYEREHKHMHPGLVCWQQQLLTLRGMNLDMPAASQRQRLRCAVQGPQTQIQP